MKVLFSNLCFVRAFYWKIKITKIIIIIKNTWKNRIKEVKQHKNENKKAVTRLIIKSQKLIDNIHLEEWK